MGNNGKYNNWMFYLLMSVFRSSLAHANGSQISMGGKVCQWTCISLSLYLFESKEKN